MNQFEGIDITEEELREAVLGGAVCAECGGVHLYTRIERAVRFADEDRVPVCLCEDCDVCHAACAAGAR